MTQTLEVNGIELWAYHGCLAEEAVIGGRYRIDVRFLVDMEMAARTDELEHAIDYVRVVEVVRAEMSTRANLIENVANRIATALVATFDRAEQITVRLTKFSPPVNGPLESSVVEWTWARP